MRQNLLIISLLFTVSFLFAQEKPKEYLVYLKDGSMYKGTVQEYEYADKTFEIIIEEEVVAKVHKKHIKRITKLRPNDYFLKNGRSFRTEGFYTGFNLIQSIGDNFGHSGLNARLGYYLKPNIVVGVGSGFELYYSPVNNSSIRNVPLYGFIRGFPFQKTVSPYYALEMGWGIGSGSYTTYSFAGFTTFPSTGFGGFSGNVGLFSYQSKYRIKPAIGIRIASKRKSSFVIETGIVFQKAYVEFEGYDRNIRTFVDSKGDIIMSRWTLDFGWMF